jgi:polyphosphate kinase 2 (PPK2 family)
MSHSFEQDAAHSLRLALIEAQYALRATADAPRGRGVLVLVSGIELAGKGDALTQLREWLDPRLLKVSAKLPQTFQGQQPLWQPYVQDLPHRGEMVVMFGNWYGDLLTARLAGKKKRLSRAAFEQQVADLRAFETHLAHEGITVIKCWFDLPWAVLQTRLDQIDPDLQQWQQLHGLDWRKHTDYDDVQAARRLLGDDWVNIDGQHPAQRDVQFGQVVLAA